MNITELLNVNLIKLELSSKTKEDVIKEMVTILDKDGKLLDVDKYLQAVLDRETEFSTGIGMGIAIPHGKSSGVKEPALVFGRSVDGIDYQSMDDELAHIFFLIAVPEESSDEHLKILGQISRKLMHSELRDSLMKASSAEEIITLLEQ
ncbi:PTS sugar transporter subunit IIA [Clostridium tagluense]|uniref:PTS sugar transporter subunit IIA n=1 Tax=Clostridium tagluense TaxID=360422 RepID=UPI001C0C6F6A|nr:PTS sugar transporter subunit IIA [Clostridium tagluense]MBU3130317.1 PTS sugar transporter subunit IIA [Clostridium tagluense]MCB2313608.1 PTS sugar transporter subunit IIA [Clostridium tagluense]MCB2318491.1 PTS sugar transporter subunit IIA [Clostridium tagluense]MCB2323273.1 PTS sugar transporter subunit IIA [Clostridium tagluense]MCB2328216.1 PTS sugar transporter subunit IIA [Clostridium tagluense]